LFTTDYFPVWPTTAVYGAFDAGESVDMPAATKKNPANRS